MKTRIVLVSLLALVLTFATGCASRSASGSGKETTDVVAGFYPLAYAAEAIGGSSVAVSNLTPTGAEPHDLEVTPSDVQEIRSADLVLLLGDGFQPQLERAAGDGANVVRLLDTAGLRRSRDSDPHVWLDPLRYALIVERIGAALHRKPAAARLVARLHILDRDYRRSLSNCARDEVVTSHEAFAYLSRRYGLRQIAITGLSPEAEPSPRALEDAIVQVRRTHATTVFFEPLVSPRIAETVARDADVKKAILDPIEGLTPDEEERGADYFTLMRSNLAALRSALGCH